MVIFFPFRDGAELVKRVVIIKNNNSRALFKEVIKGAECPFIWIIKGVI